MIRTTSQHPEVKFTANGVLYASKQVINELARNAMESILESTLEMYADDNEEEISRSSIEKDIEASLRNRTLEFLEDAISDYKNCLLAAVRSATFTAKVRGLDYARNGDIEDIKIDFNYTPAV